MVVGVGVRSPAALSAGHGAIRCAGRRDARASAREAAAGAHASVAVTKCPRGARGRFALRASAEPAENELKVTKPDLSFSTDEQSGLGIYEVNLPKPLGVSFARGNDGMTYVARIDPKRGNVDGKMQVGDKILKVSASFGSEVWEALNYGQVAYAIRTRSGDLYFQLQSNGGDLSCFQPLKKDKTQEQFAAERAGGNYGIGTKELQQRNYIAAKEALRKRKEIFDDALSMFQAGKYEKALVEWENVLGMEPKGYMSDSFSKVTDIYRVTAYNIACCYSKMGQVDAGLSALDDCMNAGYEGFDKIRGDPNLAALRDSEKFKPLMNKYDEPIINEEAIQAIKNLFNPGAWGK